MRCYIQFLISGIPERVGFGRGAVVKHSAGINPAVIRKIEPKNMIMIIGGAQAAPPTAVVPPQFAFWLLAFGSNWSRRGRPGAPCQMGGKKLLVVSLDPP